MAAMDAPRGEFSIESATDAVQGLGWAGALAISAAAVALAVTLQPLQFRLVQILEGYWPTGHSSLLFRAGIRLQQWRYNRLRGRLVSTKASRSAAHQRVVDERMLHAEVRLRARFPEEGRLLPTSLGNALRSAEDRVGRRYGLESVTIWPRLYPLLPAEFRDSLEDEVTQLDVSARLSVTWGATASVAGFLVLTDFEALRSSPGWILVSLGLWVLSWLSYKAAVESALAHGTDLEVAMDLHRSLVLRAMRLPPATRLSEERRVFRRLSRFLAVYDPNHGYELEFEIDGHTRGGAADETSAR